MIGKEIYINGDIEKCRKQTEIFKSVDKIVYVWKGKKYDDIGKVFEILEREQEYLMMKNFNECQYIIENVIGAKYKRTYYPMYMQLEQTSYCNAKCIMCSHYYSESQTCIHLQDDVYDKIKKWLPYVRMVGLHGFGEPFIYPKLIERLEQYRKYGVKFWTNTNLSVIPDGIEKYWKDFAFLNISCDGATKEIFEGIRTNLSFGKFINNVKIVREQAPDLRLILTVVLMRQNIHQCEEFVKLAASLGINEVTFSKVGINYAIGNYEDSMDNYPMVLLANLQKAKTIGEQLRIKVTIPMSKESLETKVEWNDYMDECKKMERIPFWTYTPEKIRNNSYKEKIFDLPVGETVREKCFLETKINVQGVCDWLVNNIYISANGKVAFCCSNAKYYIGDLKEQSLDEVWNCKHYKTMIEMFCKGKLPLYCKNCNLMNKGMLKNAKLI